MSGGIDLAALPEDVRTIVELAAQVSADVQDTILTRMREMVASRG